MNCLALTPTALFRLSQFSISPEWFSEFGIPLEAGGLKRVMIGETVYILETNLTSDDGGLVLINLEGDTSVFRKGHSNISALERIITVGRYVFTESVAIPTGWRQYREGHLFSVSASSRDTERKGRIYFDQRPNNREDLFVYARTEEAIDFSKLKPALAVHENVRSNFAEAVLSEVQKEENSASLKGIVLTRRLPQGFVQGASLTQWYDNKLTKDQRAFVDKLHDGPVRLRGSAGTGKTLSLVVKFLRDAQRCENEKAKVKFGFLTHSLSSIDTISAIAESLDNAGLMFDQGKFAKLELRTLYDLAQEHLHFDLDNLTPLSLDGREGRRMQRELIQSVLSEMASSKPALLQFEDLSIDLKNKWDAAAAQTDHRLVLEVMNEFANVLDAEGVRAGEENGERYAKGPGSGYRPVWLMSLPLEIDRRFLLEIHRRYRKMLSEMDTLSVDQMVADFNSFLDSNRWDLTRSRDGYDALFVDELHLFTSIERQILHKLINRAEENGKPKRPPIFMAYDLKQSPHDTFAQYVDGETTLFSQSTGLQNSDLVQLDRVFRYTPQIAEFLADLDASFPAIDIPGDWGAYVGKAELDDGVIPELTVYKNDIALFKSVFDAAHRTARTIEGGGRRVAVLCPGEDIFDKYLTAVSGQYEGKVLPITNREPSSELRHAGKRFIFSMPEYVAGLQFDAVYLIHADAKEALVDASIGTRRRFISSVYLGASRAEKTLQISSSVSRGGPSDILNFALERGSLRRAE